MRGQDPARWWFLVAVVPGLAAVVTGLVTGNSALVVGGALGGAFWLVGALFLILFI